MSEEEQLDPEELEELQAEELPDRELMSIVDLELPGQIPPAEFDSAV